MERKLIERVQRLRYNPIVADRFEKHKLSIVSIAWEDTGRDKNSSVGPNISDLTLDVEGRSFPLIRPNNYEDRTCDWPIERFALNVGNDASSCTKLQRISLSQYLTEIEKYVAFSVEGGSLLSERDTALLTSAQCCVLPIENERVAFTLRIHNYQCDKAYPACLVIVASPHGTSAQLLTERNQHIFFNKGGRRADYVAERVETRRKREGRSEQGPLNQDEKEDNALFVFQVPLMVDRPVIHGVWENHGLLDSDDDGLCLGSSDEEKEEGEAAPKCALLEGAIMYGSEADQKCALRAKGMSHAQLSVGEAKEAWVTNSHLRVKRDPAFPIRCTIQYYRVTDTDAVSEETVREIADQVWRLFKQTPLEQKGSLVVDGETRRVTEAALPERPDTQQVFFSF